MSKLLALLCFLMPFTLTAQNVVTGKVIDKTLKKPVAGASVFLNNSVVGTETGDDGTFILNNVRTGQYDLVVSSVGFETSHQNIMVNASLNLPPVELSPKLMLLDEVKIKPNDNWDRDFRTFKRLFFGISENADQCSVLNPELLSFDYDPNTLMFNATSSDFLEIENKALGYKIRYLLTRLQSDGRSGMSYFEGSASFRELQGSTSQQRRWKSNRLKAYNGSSMHFLRSTISNTLQDEGFTMYRLIRTQNPDYKPGSTKKTVSTLVTIPLTINDFVRLTDVNGEFALGFKNCLYITYRMKKLKVSNKNPEHATEMADHLSEPDVTIITFDDPYAFYDSNGIIINPHSVIFEGRWGKSLVADLLPVDYVPGVEK